MRNRQFPSHPFVRACPGSAPERWQEWPGRFPYVYVRIRRFLPGLPRPPPERRPGGLGRALQLQRLLTASKHTSALNASWYYPRSFWWLLSKQLVLEHIEFSSVGNKLQAIIHNLSVAQFLYLLCNTPRQSHRAPQSGCLRGSFRPSKYREISACAAVEPGPSLSAPVMNGAFPRPVVSAVTVPAPRSVPPGPARNCATD